VSARIVRRLIDVLRCFGGASFSTFTDTTLSEQPMQRNSVITSVDSSDLRIADERRAISEIATAIDLAARSDVSVLITGETGSGNELIARLIHRRSVRAVAPFVVVSCAGVPERELESELFGHTGKGAGRVRPARARHFDLAQSGTILLEGVAGLSSRIQERLFKLLEAVKLQPTDANLPHRTCNVRSMTATSPELYANVVAGEFREDLYYRLNVVHVRVPLSGERLSDVALLVDRALTAEQDLPKPFSIGHRGWLRGCYQ
jgi:transcriptional regulator with GAF, ATPase, and Fis domain